MDGLMAGIAGVAMAGISALITYLTMRRTKSGQINSSEADLLWKESTAIRREQREQVQQLELHIAANETEIAQLRTDNAELKYEVLTLRQENAGLRVQVEALRAENVVLRAGQVSAAASEEGAL